MYVQYRENFGNNKSTRFLKGLRESYDMEDLLI